MTHQKPFCPNATGVCATIIAIDERVKDCTLEELYSVWVRSRPSRSAFVNLVNEMEELWWIRKKLGAACCLEVDQDAMRKALLISPQDMTGGWLFDKGVFDDSMLFANGNSHPLMTPYLYLSGSYDNF